MNVKLCHEVIKQNKKNKVFCVVDVRTPEEFREGHIQNAVNLDCSAVDFDEILEKLDRKKGYMVYCQHDPRSQRVVEFMLEKGFVDVVFIECGLEAWKNEGFKVVKS